MALNKERAVSCLRRFVCCLLFLVFGVAGPVRAALQFDVFLGYGDVVADASWFPATFEIKNDGPTFNGVIEISNSQMGQGQTRRVPIDLPTGTLKRVFVPVFCSAVFEGWTFRLLDERGRVKAEYFNRHASKSVQHDTLVIGAVSRTQAGLPILPPIAARLPPERQPVAGRILPALFPDNPIALEGCSLIYLSTEAALTLTVPQSQALTLWMLGGGHLIVAIESLVDLNGLPWLRNLLPMRPTSISTIKSGTALDQWIRTGAGLGEGLSGTTRNRSTQRPPTGTLMAGYREVKPDPGFEDLDLATLSGSMLDGRTTLAAAGTPLMIEAPRGRGRITLLTFNPEREPFLSWKNKSWFWARLGEVPARLFESSDLTQRGGWSIDGLFGALIDSKQVRKLPLAWLLLLLVAYLLVIGPFDRYWLKKINRQMLTWITFPCYVVFFSALIYFIGFKLRAGDSELNELSLVDLLPGSLRGRTFSSIYSPANNSYSLAGGQRFSAMRGEFMGGYSRGGGESSQGSIVSRGNGFEARVFVPVWTSQLFVSDWLEPAGPSALLAVRATPAAGGWKIVVENRSGRVLSQSHVVLEKRVYRLGDLPAGGPKEFVVQTSQGTPLGDFARQHGGKFLQMAQQRRNTFGNNRPDLVSDLAIDSLAASFTSMVNDGNDPWQRFITVRGLDLAGQAEEGNVILLAWDAGHSATKPFNQFEPRRLRRDTLYRLVTPLNPNTASPAP